MADGAAWPVETSARRAAALRRAPLFSGLDEGTLAAVETRVEPVPVPGGGTLFQSGDPGDALYVVSFGCLAVFDSPALDGSPRVIAEIPVGDIVGEMSLIGHRRRSHTVAAIRDSEVLRLTRADFERLCADHPGALMGLLSKLVDRYGSTPRPDQRPPRTIALMPHGRDAPAADFAGGLAAALMRLQGGAGKVAVIGPDAAGEPPEYFHRAEAESAFVVYRADTGLTPWTRRCLRQADSLLVVARAGEPPQGPQLIDAIRAEEAFRGGPFRARRELVLVHDGRRPRPGSTATWLAGQDYGMHHHVRLGRDNDFNRLARLLLNRSVGVVMAGGGARGFAHIGVIKALREAGVPVDMFGGTSMGAIVAAGAASGWTDEELGERFRRSFVDSNPLSGFTLPLVSLYSGRKVTSLLRMAFGDFDIEDMPKPFYCVSANLTRQSADVHRRGKLWYWLRASVSIPGVLPPVVDGGHVHVDGGVIDNFPVDAMRAIGRGPVIGADIDTGGGLVAGADVVDSWSAWEFARRLVWKRSQTLPIPSIVRLLLRSALIGSTSRALADRSAVDLLVLPSMQDIDLLEWQEFDRAVEAGYRATMEALENVRGEPLASRLYIV
ncbi:MAG: patatin-like phospholipase family protein [Rhodospirillales bacterium]|nr:MAG: patatin-like phospholipase family protein [Rhodospirillales bacterium]